jgi:YggT family protein
MTETLAQSILRSFISPAISLMIFLIFIEVIFSWLLAFNVINLRNPTVAQIYQIVNRLTSYILDPIRKVIPSFGGLDFSPIVALLGLSWINSYVVGQVLYPMLG